ncbi:hypothetical protein BKA70DRAFT_1562572 [Coprinopsis sp. MPI-PUGE-AT-0042]|nr:hypothetical protein BKA70DRAFT_1562572 [Coprinopsis sp. MPI-PUGE-AT-0042]
MAENRQDSPIESDTFRSVAYYFQNVIIKVERCLYSIPKQALTSQSPVFEGMFDGNNDGGGEGASDKKPIVLEGYKSGEFECLLNVMLPQPLERKLPALTKEQWVSVLKLSTVWQMDQIRQLAVEQLSQLDPSPIEKVVLAREYRVLKWLTEGVTTLAIDFDQYPIKDVAQALGWETTALILSIRDQAKPKVLESDELIRGFTCYQYGHQLSQSSGYVRCTGGCGYMLRGGSATSTRNDANGKLAVSQAVVSTVFADEIQVLQT